MLMALLSISFCLPAFPFFCVSRTNGIDFYFAFVFYCSLCCLATLACPLSLPRTLSLFFILLLFGCLLLVLCLYCDCTSRNRDAAAFRSISVNFPSSTRICSIAMVNSYASWHFYSSILRLFHAWFVAMPLASSLFVSGVEWLYWMFLAYFDVDFVCVGLTFFAV